MGSRILVLVLTVLISLACKTKNKVDNNSMHDETNYDNVMDFSTSSNFIRIKVKTGSNDTMTIVAPAEILQRYLRDGYSSDRLYRNAIMSSSEKYLDVSAEIYKSFKSYRVDFSEDFINLWMLKDKRQIIDSFFEKSINGVYYICFEKSDIKNQVIFLLLKKGSHPYKDDETGCTIINDEADTNSR